MVQNNAINNQTSQLTVDPAVTNADSFIQFSEETTAKWIIGNDATDDSFQVALGSALGTSTSMTVSTSNNIGFPNGNVLCNPITAGATVTFQGQNSDNTNAASHCRVASRVGGASAGDPYLQVLVLGATGYTIGIDNSDSDTLNINLGSTFAGTDAWTMTTAGERTMPLQPAFLARLGTSDTNVTGNNTNYFLGNTDIGNTLTEIYDQNGDFTPGASGGAIFTAPVTGKYQIGAHVVFHTLVAGDTVSNIRLSTSNGSYYYGNIAIGVIRDVNNYGGVINGSVLADMDAADTFKCSCLVSGSGSDNVGLLATDRNVHMFGSLIC